MGAIGGIEIVIGKLAIYTAAGGIDPARVIPVMLDVGTDRDSLRADPMYPGNRHPCAFAASATTHSSKPTSRPPPGCFRKLCCS